MLHRNEGRALGRNPQKVARKHSGKHLRPASIIAGEPVSERFGTFQVVSGCARACEVCEGPVEDARINRDLLAETGMTVCKACIDEALVLICGQPPLARLISRIVSECNNG
jgi:hypothetical protein